MSANLIIQTAFLGDLLLSIPLLKHTRKLWPEKKLLLVCRQGLGDFFAHTGLADEVFEIKKGDAQSYQQILEKINSFDIDCLISPHESWRTAFFCRRIKARHKISFKKFGKSLFFDQLLPRPEDLPDALRQLSLLSVEDAELAAKIQHYREQGHAYAVTAEGRLSAPPSWATMDIREKFLRDSAGFESLKNKFSLEKLDFKKLILIFPGSVWATKRWTETGFVETGRSLQQKGFQIVVMGGPGEELLSERVAAQIPGSRCLGGRTSLYESALLICHSALVVGNDSAAVHMAAMCGTPAVTVFGPTIIQFGYRPWSAETYLVEDKNLSCRPCGKHGHQKCPIGTHDCMKHIPPQEVLEKIRYAVTFPDASHPEK